MPCGQLLPFGLVTAYPMSWWHLLERYWPLNGCGVRTLPIRQRMYSRVHRASVLHARKLHDAYQCGAMRAVLTRHLCRRNWRDLVSRLRAGRILRAARCCSSSLPGRHFIRDIECNQRRRLFACAGGVLGASRQLAT